MDMDLRLYLGANKRVKRIDITGERYGRMLVIREYEQVGYDRYFLCKCDCGNEKIVRMNELRSGKTKSCGCLNREMTSKSNTIDLTGKRFGKITVVERSSSKSKTNKVLWICRCDCGNEITTLSTYLTSGDTNSCGCHKIEVGNQLQEYIESNLRIDEVVVTSLKRKVRSDSTTGIKGVQYIAKNGKYRASISVKGKRYFLGEFVTIKEAIAARVAGEEKYHKPYLE
jgi:hypothetical protein